MKKILLGILAAGTLALAGCSGNGGSGSSNFRKCTYLMIGGDLLVSEDGPTKSVKMVATYTIDVDDYEEISAQHITGLPTSFNVVVDTYAVYPSRLSEAEHVAPSECPLTLNTVSGYKNYTMSLKENSVAYYETYGEYYLSESTRTLKAISHEDVRTSASLGTHDSAYIGPITITALADDIPTDLFKVETQSLKIGERTFERMISLGSEIYFVYTLEPEQQA